MMTSLDETTQFVNARLARIRALEEAHKTFDGVRVLHNVWTAATVTLGGVALWLHPTVRWMIGVATAIFTLRVIGTLIVQLFAGREMSRINREFPSPGGGRR
jgi:hypothetical protein